MFGIEQKLDEIKTKLQNILEENLRLNAENQQLKEDVELLKVEASLEKKVDLNINKEQEEKEEVKDEFSTSINPTAIFDESVAQKDTAQLKMKLDEFIEDIDQCIHIIKSENDGK